MDVLKNKSRINRDYISRYSSFPSYYHTLDKKYIQGITSQLSTNTPYVVINVTSSTSLEALANKYYGRPDYWWVIADFNRIQDPFAPIYPRFSQLKLPSIAGIEFMET